MKKKIIQVPMPYELLAELDAAAKERGASRSACIREACAIYLASSKEADLVRQYIDGYTKFPESDEDSEWRIKNAGDVWGEEDWDENDL